MSGVIPRTLTAPLDVVKTLKQVGTPLGIKGYRMVLVNTFKEEGVAGFYKGNLTACVRLFPYSAVQFTAYELFKNSFRSLDGGAGHYGHIAALSAGAAAGMIGTVAVYPLDVVKTRLTVDMKRAKYRSMAHAFRQIKVEEGFRGFRKGLVASVLGVVPFAGGMFMAYEALDRSWGVPKWQLSWKQNFFDGCLASAVAQTISFPLDTVRKKMQAQSPTVSWSMRPDITFTSTLEALVNTVKMNGVLGLWRGHFVNLMRVMPFNGSMFMTYEAFRRLFLYENGYTVSPFRDQPLPNVDQTLSVEDLQAYMQEVKRRLARKELRQRQIQRELLDANAEGETDADDDREEQQRRFH
eukprot:CAMPEP_0114613220 /NCGR_PEP_ID=MMETSP0168-20121206/5019_1 /TAXON_ID=95228 ORGANISM="Vannella sp., Strain DIVA3 517/6/12" /NCGR_SAMPLE_ID=MMETSP0168 /ASSEMBLY_ACC=CAM_ASM_000044 /LENGTH=351 /DNA_ID=CAMNT_0001824217 /DNA_START=187 /DNA_END=1242 /DNA_ORIENTATION=+